MSDSEYIIAPGGKWFRLPWREVIEYRDLLFLLVRRDFVSKYKQTVLGPLWFVLQPLLMTVVFTVIFGKVARLSTDGLPHMLFYLCGMLGWRYFALCMRGTSATFLTNTHLFSKVYFPRIIVPLAVVISNMLAFGIQLVTFLCFWVYFKLFTPAGGSFGATPSLLALPAILLVTAAIGLGVGLWMSALTAKYRDFFHLSDFLSQLWMYMTPVIWPMSLWLSKLEEAGLEQWGWLVALNPMSAIVEWYRYAFLGVGTIEPLFMAISGGVTVVLLVSGILIFSRTERTFIDTV